MNFDKLAIKKAMNVYLVSDRSWVKESLITDIEQAIKGGVTCVQIREKNMEHEMFLKEALAIKALCDTYHIPFIVNDDVMIALEVDADGIHVGQHDLDAKEVRKKMGKDKILGVSVQTVEQAMLAQEQGADYLGVGAVFSTSTKVDADVVSLTTLTQICEAVAIPVVAIGGITRDRISELKDTGINGVAVVSAILASNDIKQASEELVICTNKIL